MTLFKDGVDISGGNVKLTDVITMEIQLDPKFKGNLNTFIYIRYRSYDTN
jgi:hypothetical protein